MITIPREYPVITSLNSYYINVDRLIEHYQGTVDAGCVLFEAPYAEGAIFFDESTLLNGIFYDKKAVYKGPDAIHRLVSTSSTSNYSISVYKISVDRLDFWANLAHAEPLYRNLSTEFTDLEALTRKLHSEKFTGYVEVKMGKGAERETIYFINGMNIGSSVPEKNQKSLDRSGNRQKTLILKSREQGAILNVQKIPVGRRVDLPSLMEKKTQSESLKKDKASDRTLEMLHQLLIIFDKSFKRNRKIKVDFEILLKRKFMEKVDKYDFLYPFAAELTYHNGKLSYTGKVDQKTLVKGVVESLGEMALENKISGPIKKNLIHWEEKYSKETAHFNIAFKQ